MTEQPHPLNRETAEQLLSGGQATPNTAAVAGLLARAAAPAMAHELAGETAALAAFQAAKRAPKTLRVPVRRLLVLKVAAIAALVTAGGLAFASGTGILPTPFRPAPAVSPSSASSPEKTPPATSTRAPSAASSEAPQGMNGLCQAYLKKTSDEREKALKTKPFEELVTAAGGAANVDAYCASLTADKPDKSHTPKPTVGARDTNPSRGANGDN